MVKYFIILITFLFVLDAQAAFINQVEVTNFPATQAVTQSGTWTVQQGTPPWSFSLPTNAATESTLSTIDGKIPALGQATMANSMPVVIASNQTAVPASQSGTWTVQPGNTANTTAWLVNQKGSSYRAFTGSTTTTLKSGAGNLKRICYTTKGANGNTITAYDNTAGSGTVIALVTTSGTIAELTCGVFDAAFTTGLTIVTSGTAGWTVVYE